jgi:hypothetical protein
MLDQTPDNVNCNLVFEDDAAFNGTILDVTLYDCQNLRKKTLALASSHLDDYNTTPSAHICIFRAMSMSGGHAVR